MAETIRVPLVLQVGLKQVTLCSLVESVLYIHMYMHVAIPGELLAYGAQLGGQTPYTKQKQMKCALLVCITLYMYIHVRM